MGHVNESSNSESAYVCILYYTSHPRKETSAVQWRDKNRYLYGNSGTLNAQRVRILILRARRERCTRVLARRHKVNTLSYRPNTYVYLIMEKSYFPRIKRTRRPTPRHLFRLYRIEYICNILFVIGATRPKMLKAKSLKPTLVVSQEHE